MDGQLSRRRMLQLAALGATATVAGAIGLWRTSRSPEPLAVDGGSAFTEPEVLASEGGLLHVPLEAARGVQLAARETSALGFNGASPGPTWRVRPGDVVQVDLVNRLDEPTNLHVHGMHVSPEGNSDNVFVEVAAGETFRYEYHLPDDHPTGTYWYHPHLHGLVADQLFGGLVGAIVVVGDDDPDSDEDRILLVTDTTLDEDGHVVAPSFSDRMHGREGELVLVNGQFQPTLTGRTGAPERWRVINGCTSRFLRLRLEGAELTVLAMDGVRLGQPRRQDDVVLAPGNRADLSVEIAEEGQYRLRTESFDRGRMGMGSMMGGGGSVGSGPAVLATFDVTGEVASPAPAPAGDVPVEDLRDVFVDARREVVFDTGMGPGGMRFVIDGATFDPDRVDNEVRVGSVEEWVIRNPSPMDHPFHLHVWHFQVLDDGSGPVSEPEWRDVVNIPAGGEVRVRIRFGDFSGRTVYHCHILDHEDEGMMAVLVAS